MRTGASLAPLASRPFRFYYASRVVNMAGTFMASVALAFAVLGITDDPAALGYVLAAHTVPMIVFVLWGGVVADRFPRTAVLQASNLTSALTQGLVAGLVLTGVAEIWMLVALSLLHGTASAFGFPAMAAIMPSLVPREQLQQANALVSLARSALVVLGPSVGALLVVTAGAGWALAVDAAAWLVAAVLLGFVRVPPRVARPADEAAPGTFAELREGWSFVRSTTWLWVVVLAFGALNAVHAGAWTTLGPARAQDTIGAQGWGLVLSAEGAGLLLMTLVLLRTRLERPLLLGMVGMLLMAPPLIALGARPELLLVAGLALLAGAGIELFSMGWNLAMQEHVPDEMLSRVYSYDALGSFVAIPVGQVAFGPLAAAFGYTEVLVTAGVVHVAVCGLVLLAPAVRGLRRADRPPAPAPDEALSTTS